MTQAFTREYVEGLRREGQRKGLRIRDLEDALIAKAVEAEAARAGIPAEMVGDIPTLGISVDDKGVVVGVSGVVREFKANSRSLSLVISRFGETATE